MEPPPGQATVKDMLQKVERKEALVELVHGTLVEKPMRARESLIAVYLRYMLLKFFEEFEEIGICYGPDATIRFMPGIVRLPDVSFTRWERLPVEEIPQEAVPAIVPNLVVEILSKSNTVAEMERKRQEYFKAGVEQVWMIDPETRTVNVYTSVKKMKRHSSGDTFSGGTVIPGFTLPVSELFA